MNSSLHMLMEHDVREIASVVDDDIVATQSFEVLASTLALIAVRNEVKIKGQARSDFVETAHQALGIVRVFVRGAVATPREHQAVGLCLCDACSCGW